MSKPSEAALADRSDDKQRPASRLLDRLEQIARIAATLLLPVIVAIGGWAIQSSIESGKQDAELKRVSLEYVKLAKDILTSEEKPPELVKWSWQLINDAAPTKLAKDDLEQLIRRNETIPLPVSPSLPQIVAPSALNGFVILVMRSRMDRRGPWVRTVGRYHVFYDGEKLADLEGASVEAQGPG